MERIRAEKRSWPLCDGGITLDNGITFLRHRATLQTVRNDLPFEFFSHQLMSVDPLDNDSILAFAEEYGIMQHPRRFDSDFAARNVTARPTRFGIDSCGCECFVLECISGELAASEFSRQYNPAKDGFTAQMDNIDSISAALDRAIWAGVPSGRFYRTSLMEMRLAIADLQCSVSQLFDCLSGKRNDWPYAELVNAGSDNAQCVLSKHDLPVLGSLTNEICNQIIESVADERPWKTCACEGCGRLFKRHQGKRKPKTEKNPSDSVYCCKACQDRQGQRNRQARLILQR